MMMLFLESEGAIRMCGNVCWVVWSFVLGAIPRFFSSEWVGPVVPCPSDVASLAFPLAVALLSACPAKKGDKNPPGGRARDVLISLGVLATLVLAVAKVAGCLHASSMTGSLTVWMLVQSLTLPCEAVAVAGWVLLTLRLSSSGARDADGGIPFPFRVPALYAAGALWPLLPLALGLCLCGQDPCVVLLHDGVEPPLVYTLTVCSLSGLFLILLRRLRAGIRAIDLVALLSGCMTFRAMAELSHGFVETLSKSYPDILGTLAVAYVMVVAALSALLVFAVVLGRRSLQASPQSARGPRPSLAGVPGSDQLTDRERQALIDTLAGHTGKRIAEERGLAESTVGTYRRRGYEKLGVSTKRELMSLVARHGSSADDAPAGKAGEGPSASSRRRSLGMAAAPVALVFLSAFLPPVYAPLDAPPYGVDLATLFPFGIGVILVVGGMALLICRSAGKKTSGPERGVISLGKEPRGAAAFCGVASLCAGLLVGQAWQTPLPDLSSLPMIVEFLAYRLCALLGVATLLCHQAFSRRLRRGEATASVHPCHAMGEGLEVLVFDDPRSIVLLGAGFLLVNLDSKLTSYMLPEMYVHAYALMRALPRFVVLLSLIWFVASFRSALNAAAGASSLEVRLVGEGLSSLQARVVAMSLEGASCDEIGRRLHLAPSTVRAYRSKACRRLGVGSITELGASLQPKK